MGLARELARLRPNTSGQLPTANIQDDAINAAKIAAGAVNSSEIADGAVTGAKIIATEGWNVTSSNGTACTWLRAPIGRDRFLWVLYIDSINSGTYINMPSGTGSNGTSLVTWYSPDHIHYAECTRSKRYSWHGSEAQRGFTGWNYVVSGNNQQITRMNHNLGGVDAIFTAVMITVGQ